MRRAVDTVDITDPIAVATARQKDLVRLLGKAKDSASLAHVRLNYVLQQYPEVTFLDTLEEAAEQSDRAAHNLHRVLRLLGDEQAS